MQVDYPSHDEFDDLTRAHDKVSNGGHSGDGLSTNGKDAQLSIVVVETQETKQNIHTRQTNTTRDNNITRDNNTTAHSTSEKRQNISMKNFKSPMQKNFVPAKKKRNRKKIRHVYVTTQQQQRKGTIFKPAKKVNFQQARAMFDPDVTRCRRRALVEPHSPLVEHHSPWQQTAWPIIVVPLRHTHETDSHAQEHA
jgi:hypothetical protein